MACNERVARLRHNVSPHKTTTVYSFTNPSQLERNAPAMLKACGNIYTNVTDNLPNLEMPLIKVALKDERLSHIRRPTIYPSNHAPRIRRLCPRAHHQRRRLHHHLQPRPDAGPLGPPLLQPSRHRDEALPLRTNLRHDPRRCGWNNRRRRLGCLPQRGGEAVARQLDCPTSQVGGAGILYDCTTV